MYGGFVLMRRVILNFHGIGTPQRTLEPDEDRYWVTPEVFTGTLELADRHADRVETILTFDDGNRSDLEIAAPLLARHGRRATFFVLAARIDTGGSLSGEDMRELVAQGHAIGTHGADHVDWRALDAAGETREWETARDAIARAAGTPVDAAAIPFGRYRAGVLKGLKQRGYREIYSSDGGAWRPGDLPIPRTSPRADMTLDDIENVILGREPLKAQVRRRMAMSAKRWV